MFLKNYTSDVPVSQTVHRIEQVLIKCGVSGITKEYGPSEKVLALHFHIKLEANQPSVTIRMPADEQAALQALWLDYVDGDRLSEDGSQIVEWSSRKKKSRKDFIEQAERTAWKLMQDWVEVQMSMIQMKQADFIQVFLPYVWDAQLQQTFYQRLKTTGFRALLPEKSEA
jgi:hypothetical protein